MWKPSEIGMLLRTDKDAAMKKILAVFREEGYNAAAVGRRFGLTRAAVNNWFISHPELRAKVRAERLKIGDRAKRA